MSRWQQVQLNAQHFNLLKAFKFVHIGLHLRRINQGHSALANDFNGSAPLDHQSGIFVDTDPQQKRFR